MKKRKGRLWSGDGASTRLGEPGSGQGMKGNEGCGQSQVEGWGQRPEAWSQFKLQVFEQETNTVAHPYLQALKQGFNQPWVENSWKKVLHCC